MDTADNVRQGMDYIAGIGDSARQRNLFANAKIPDLAGRLPSPEYLRGRMEHATANPNALLAQSPGGVGQIVRRRIQRSWGSKRRS